MQMITDLDTGRNGKLVYTCSDLCRMLEKDEQQVHALLGVQEVYTLDQINDVVDQHAEQTYKRRRELAQLRFDFRYGNHLVYELLSEAGLYVIPLRTDGSKAPIYGDWQRATKSYLERSRTINAGVAAATGLGIVCGAASGNLEVIDFDLDAALIFPQFKAKAIDLIRSYGMPIVQTPSGGFHLYYRCSEIAGNLKLAQCPPRPDGKNTLIETRGEGGQVATVGTPPWAHKLKKEYRLIYGDLLNVPVIGLSERVKLHCIARSFTQISEDELRQLNRPSFDSHTTFTNSNSIFSDFNLSLTWESVLIPHGWRLDHCRGETCYWTRPHKDSGISATTGHCGDLMYVFSSNCLPFVEGKAYDKFEAYCLLNKRDKSVLIALAEEQGYGSFALRAQEQKVETLLGNT